ncbi:MAG TPA: CstA-like transporter-associated (seleno)protein [Candidatus Dormibacteraeota bacterium]|nr:CstA-like transporter-associated (seleno)protein [Candidatus Dormibacteraeota bacterium]
MHKLFSESLFHLPAVLNRATYIMQTAWRGLREWSGDAAYDRYLESGAVRRGSVSALSRKNFYLEQLNRRYSRPNRCC